MSSFGKEEIENALESLRRGRWDDVSPAMMAEVEALLNESPEAARRFEDLSANLGDGIPVPGVDVDDQDWEGVWRRIDQGMAERGEQAPADLGRRWLRWAPIVSVAAALLMVVTVQFVISRNEASHGLRLAGPGDAQVESVEVFDDSMPFIHSAIENGDVSILWVVEEPS